MNPQSDKNFLFALLAYQNDYITTEQFFEAASAWNKDPKRPIAEIMIELKFIEEVEGFNIQGIVEDRIRRQGGIDNTLSFALKNGNVPDGPQLPEDWTEQITKVIRNKVPPTPPNLQNNQASSGIGRYIIRRVLGHGGQGYVWEAIDTELNRKVAIKNVHPDLSSDPLHQELLLDEARKTGKLGHPGVPPIFDIGKDSDGKPFFTMQLINGQKLSEQYSQLRYESISKTEYVNQLRPVLRHLIAACHTVQYAFDNEDVIHRDIKPGNIMVNQYGETIVMDWGMGKIVSDPSAIKDDASSVLLIPLSHGSGSMEKNSIGTIKGSVMYMSPEQARAENDRLDHRTDVYGLGATLYWILTGVAPHKGTRASLPDIQKNRFPTPSQARPLLGIPRELEAICLKAMASKPEDRYQKSGQMAADLENYIAGEPVVALPENFLRKTERFLRKHARGVIASLLALSLAVLGLTWANLVITGQKNTIAMRNSELANQNKIIQGEREKTERSRDFIASILDDLIGYLIDNSLSQIPGGETVRFMLLERNADAVEKYIQENPDDTELKIDLIRLLTRLAKLQQDQQTQESMEKANKIWDRIDQLLQETKATNDETFQLNWKKVFCDKAYYQVGQYVRQGKTTEANSILRDAFAYAKEIVGESNDRNLEFSATHAGLYRRQSALFDASENWEQAAAETQKGRDILLPFVEEYLSTPTAETTQGEMISETELDSGILGNFLLMSGDLADYQTLSGRLDQARQIASVALGACGLAPRVLDAELDGLIQSGANYRRLHRIALLQKDFESANGFYAKAREFIDRNRMNPYVLRAWLFIESDRARGLAGTDLNKAAASLDEAIRLFRVIQNDPEPGFQPIRAPHSIAEMECCIAAAKLAIAKAESQNENLPALVEEKNRCVQRLKDTGAGPAKIREFFLMP